MSARSRRKKTSILDMHEGETNQMKASGLRIGFGSQGRRQQKALRKAQEEEQERQRKRAKRLLERNRHTRQRAKELSQGNYTIDLTGDVPEPVLPATASEPIDSSDDEIDNDGDDFDFVPEVSKKRPPSARNLESENPPKRHKSRTKSSKLLVKSPSTEVQTKLNFSPKSSSKRTTPSSTPRKGGMCAPSTPSASGSNSTHPNAHSTTPPQSNASPTPSNTTTTKRNAPLTDDPIVIESSDDDKDFMDENNKPGNISRSDTRSRLKRSSNKRSEGPTATPTPRRRGPSATPAYALGVFALNQSLEPKSEPTPPPAASPGMKNLQDIPINRFVVNGDLRAGESFMERKPRSRMGALESRDPNKKKTRGRPKSTSKQPPPAADAEDSAAPPKLRKSKTFDTNKRALPLMSPPKNPFEKSTLRKKSPMDSTDDPDYKSHSVLPANVRVHGPSTRLRSSGVDKAIRATKDVDTDEELGASTNAFGQELEELNERIKALTVEENKKVSSLSKKGRNSIRRGGVKVECANIVLQGADFRTLRGHRWLNDEIINSFAALLNERNKDYFRQVAERKEELPALTEDQQNASHASPSDFDALFSRPRPRTHMFNSFFMTRLRSGNEGYDYAGVRRWPKRAKVVVADLDLVLIPLNLDNVHWVLVAVDLRAKEFLYCDSMRGSDLDGALHAVRRWLKDEITNKCGKEKADDMDIDNWNDVINPSYIPTQGDQGSCGVFTLYNADYLELGHKPPFSQSDIGVLRKRTVLFLERNRLADHPSNSSDHDDDGDEQ